MNRGHMRLRQRALFIPWPHVLHILLGLFVGDRLHDSDLARDLTDRHAPIVGFLIAAAFEQATDDLLVHVRILPVVLSEDEVAQPMN